MIRLVRPAERHQRLRVWSTRIAALPLLLAAACSGARNAPVVPPPEPSSPPAPSALVAAPAPLRRLTNVEYDNTVRDLLGDTSRPAAAFPPDEVVGGFENNTVSPVSQLIVERYVSAAEALAAAAGPRIAKLAPCPKGEAPAGCATKFIDDFGRRAFRRPLDEAERAAFLSLYADKERRDGHARAIQLVIEAMLQSPSFLYRVEPIDEAGPRARALSGYEIATRLSYFLWASTPDSALLDEAAAGKLTSPDDIAKTARKMLAEPRAADGVRSFHRQWLSLREIENESKDPALYPAFTPKLKESMVEETLRFATHATLSGGDVVAALLTSSKTFVDPALAKLYGVAPPAGEGFSLVELPAGQRAGLLTQASVMTVLASAEDTSPILRGKFVREKLMCQPIPPPPANAVIALPKFDPKLTKKARFDLHRTDSGCSSCHRMMDPIGFGFEHYDALGVWRTVDGAFPVDAVGALTGAGDADGPFDGAVALGARLAASQRVRRCVAMQWFRAGLGRVERDEDEASFERTYRAFSAAGFDARELIVAIVTSDAFRHVGHEAGGAP